MVGEGQNKFLGNNCPPGSPVATFLLGTFSFICQGASTRKQLRDLFCLRVKCYFCMASSLKVGTIPISASPNDDTTSEPYIISLQC